MMELVARARGLSSRLLTENVLVELDRAHDLRSLAIALGHAGVSAEANAIAVDRAVSHVLARELAVLARWAEGPDVLTALELDEDRRSLRGIARGVVAGVSAERRLDGAVPTSRLSESVLAAIAAATTLEDVAKQLARIGHPLAEAFEPATIDLLQIELALARSFVARTRGARDEAARIHVTQIVDVENVAALTAMVARGRELQQVFVDGGRLGADALASIARNPEASRDALARAFVGTPIAAAVFAATPSALEDAALNWQLATQARLRRTLPDSMAAVIYFVLRRRREARQLRRAAWGVAFGGAA